MYSGQYTGEIMTTDTKIDIETYKNEYQNTIDRLIDEYGNPSLIPHEEQYFAGEKLRAAYCIYINPSLPTQQVLKQYAVDHRVWSYFVDSDVSTQLKAERRMSRAEKVNSVLKWGADNVGKQITLQTMIQECDIAYSMAKKITEDRPDVFRKVKRGQFEIRDPKADRETEKTKDDADSDTSKAND